MLELIGVTGDHSFESPRFNFPESKVASPRTDSQKRAEPGQNPGLRSPNGDIFLHTAGREMVYYYEISKFNQIKYVF